MISDQALGTLRAAATLIHTLPGLGLRVRDGGRLLLEVGVGPAPKRPRVRSCTPCGFRAAVGRAHQRHREGQRLAFLDLPGGVDPGCEIVTGPGDAARPGGLHRVRSGGRWLWAFATTIDPETAEAIGAPVAAGAPPLAAGDLVGLRHDQLTEVTVAYAETSSRPGSAEEARAIELLEQLLATFTAHELISAADRATI